MPSYVVKRSPEHDEYLLFSTVVDHPTTYVLTREQMLACLSEDRQGADPAARLDRADLFGTSAMFYEAGPKAEGGWEDDGFWMNPGDCDRIPQAVLMSREELFEHMREDEAVSRSTKEPA